MPEKREVQGDAFTFPHRDDAVDVNGYPLASTLALIATAPAVTEKQRRELLEFVADLWWNRRLLVRVWGLRWRFATFATGGWSGNEDLIAALEDNEVFWLMSWEASFRGGLYHFTVEREERG